MWFLRILIVVGFASIWSLLDVDVQADAELTMFTVIGIFYPLAVSNMLGLSFDEINDDSLRNDYKGTIRSVFLNFTVMFCLSAAMLTICPVFRFEIRGLAVLDYDHFVLVWELFTLAFFCFNFYNLMKLRGRVDNCIRQGRLDAARHQLDSDSMKALG